MIFLVLWHAYLLNYAFVWGVCGLDFVQRFTENGFNMIRAAAYACMPPSSVWQHCKMALIYDFLGFLAGISPQLLIRLGCLWAWLPSTFCVDCVWHRYSGPAWFHDDELNATTYENVTFSGKVEFFEKSRLFQQTLICFKIS